MEFVLSQIDVRDWISKNMGDMPLVYRSAIPTTGVTESALADAATRLRTQYERDHLAAVRQNNPGISNAECNIAAGLETSTPARPNRYNTLDLGPLPAKPKNLVSTPDGVFQRA